MNDMPNKTPPVDDQDAFNRVVEYFVEGDWQLEVPQVLNERLSQQI